jgi:thiosulfate/3-mercaptopyruvate sulfurtransferase
MIHSHQRSFLARYGLLLSLCLLLPTLLPAKTPPFKDFNHPRLIETGELAAVAGHDSIRIVDMRGSFDDYLRGHLPNAVYLHSDNLSVPRNGIPAQAPDRPTLEKLIGDYLGASNDMWIILYCEGSNPNAAFLAWYLDFLVQKKVGILNGGWEKWVSEKHPTTQAFPSLLPKKFIGKIKRASLAEKSWVRERLLAKDVVMVDARSPTQYSGEEGEEIRKGHIPGARNIFWEATMEGDEARVWKKREDLEKLFAEAGVTRDKEIVVYSRAGRGASHVYFTLKFVLGFPSVRLYRGSWVEWSADQSLPVRTGLQP